MRWGLKLQYMNLDGGGGGCPRHSLTPKPNIPPSIQPIFTEPSRCPGLHTALLRMFSRVIFKIAQIGFCYNSHGMVEKTKQNKKPV